MAFIAVPKLTKNRIIAAAIIAAVVILLVIMSTMVPPAEELSARVTGDLINSAGSGYIETETNIGFLRVLRASDKRAFGGLGSEMYIGAFGRVWDANAGVARIIADISRWMPTLLSGTGITISLTITCVCVGTILAVFLALGKMSKILPIRWFCTAYIFFFRGTPLLMQLYFIYFGLPKISPTLTIQSRFLAAFIAFALNSGAYIAELIRAALQSIDKGQFEAAGSLGMSYGQTMRLVIIPQSVRRLIPPIANEFIMVLKDASLVSLIALTDLTQATKNIVNTSLSVLVYFPAVALYLIITAVFSKCFTKLERRFSIYQ